MAEQTARTLNADSARQGRQGKPILILLIVSTLAIAIAMGVLMLMAGSNEVPDGVGVVETNGATTENLEQPTSDALAEPMETPTSAQ